MNLFTKKFIEDSLKPENFWVAMAVVVALFIPIFTAFIKLVDKWRKATILKVSFRKNYDRTYRKAVVPVDAIQSNGVFKNVERYYFRLQIKNEGGLAKRVSVRVDLFDRYLYELDYFEPSRLRWITNEEEIDLTTGESEICNLISQVVNLPQITNRLRIEVSNTTPRAIAWDRELNIYIFQVIIFGENFNPIKKHFIFTPNKNNPNVNTGDLKPLTLFDQPKIIIRELLRHLKFI